MGIRRKMKTGFLGVKVGQVWEWGVIFGEGRM